MNYRDIPSSPTVIGLLQRQKKDGQDTDCEQQTWTSRTFKWPLYPISIKSPFSDSVAYQSKLICVSYWGNYLTHSWKFEAVDHIHGVHYQQQFLPGQRDRQEDWKSSNHIRLPHHASLGEFQILRQYEDSNVQRLYYQQTAISKWNVDDTCHAGKETAWSPSTSGAFAASWAYRRRKKCPTRNSCPALVSCPCWAALSPLARPPPSYRGWQNSQFHNSKFMRRPLD